MILALIVSMNLVCAVASWGLTLGSFTQNFPYMKHTGICITFFIFGLVLGPICLIALITICLMDQRVSFRLKPLSKEERWRIFHKQFNTLDREYFEQNHG